MSKKIKNEIQSFVTKIENRKAKVGVIGLGYVGLPLVLEFNRTGFHVIGFDKDKRKIKFLMQGRSYIKHINSDRIKTMVKSKRFECDSSFKQLRKVDVIIICVPTPLTKQREPDLKYVVDTGEMIVKYLRRGQLVILESTTYPGTTNEVLRPILEQNGLRAGKDFFLAFSPEREDPGNPKYSTSKIPKVVGGLDKASTGIASLLYSQIVTFSVSVSSMDTAEAVKLTENIFRSVNIALVNELKVIYSCMDIDVWEVIEAAKTKPFGYMPFYPGPGLGGHCIPIDPFYLTWKAREFGISTRFIELAGEINTAMPEHVIHTLSDALNRDRKSIRGSKILVTGLAYKKDVEDIRESPSFVLIELLRKKGARVDYYDPYVPAVPMTREHAQLAGEKSVQWNRKTLGSYDAVLISTDHSCIDYKELVKSAKLVVDTRNATAKVKAGRNKIVKA